MSGTYNQGAYTLIAIHSFRLPCISRAVFDPDPAQLKAG